MNKYLKEFFQGFNNIVFYTLGIMYLPTPFLFYMVGARSLPLVNLIIYSLAFVMQIYCMIYLAIIDHSRVGMILGILSFNLLLVLFYIFGNVFLILQASINVFPPNFRLIFNLFYMGIGLLLFAFPTCILYHIKTIFK